MTTQYTPGPWVITYKTQSDYPHMYITHDSETRSQIIADLHCPVNIDAGGNTYSNMNKQANARLIAASPTLYEYARQQAENGCEKAKSMLALLHLTN